VIQNTGFLPDHPKDLITCSLCHARHTLKISERSVHNFLSYLAHTHRQTKTGKHITSLAEVINTPQSLFIYLFSSEHMLNKRQQLLLFTAISHKELIFYQGSVNHSLHIITTGGVGSRNYILYRYYRTIRFSFFNYTIAVTVALLYIRMLRRAIISTQFVARRESAMHRVNARAIVSRRSVDANDD